MRLVEAVPDQLPGRALAQHVEMGADPGAHARLLHLGLRVLVVAKLIVHAPDAARLAVHQHGGAGVGGRIEPGAALGRVVAVEGDVGDQVAPLVGGALHAQAQSLADEAAGAVAGDDVVGL